MQFSEGLSDRQAAEAVRARIDWKYALGLQLTDPGFDFSVLSEFRSRLVEGGKERLLLEKLLEGCKERGYLKVRGRQRTDSTHVLGALRVLEQMGADRGDDARRTERSGESQTRSGSQSTPIQSGSSVMAGVSRTRGCPRARRPGHNTSRRWVPTACGFSNNSMLLTRHKSSKSFQRSRSCAKSGSSTTRESTGGIRVLDPKEMPEAAQRIESPYEVEARYSTKRSMGWVGYKVHLTESCDEGFPHLITDVHTTAATATDVKQLCSHPAWACTKRAFARRATGGLFLRLRQQPRFEPRPP